MCQCVPSEERNAMAPAVGNRAMLPLHGVQAAISLLTPPPETIAEPVIGAEQQHAMDLRGAVDELGSPGIAVDPFDRRVLGIAAGAEQLERDIGGLIQGVG